MFANNRFICIWYYLVFSLFPLLPASERHEAQLTPLKTSLTMDGDPHCSVAGLVASFTQKNQMGQFNLHG